MRLSYMNNIEEKSECCGREILTQIENLKPEVFYADGHWYLYKEGYNDCLCEVLDIIERMIE